MINTITKSNLGAKTFIGIYSCSLSLQEPRERPTVWNWSRGHGGSQFKDIKKNCLLIIACPVCFLLHPRNYFPRGITTSSGWSLLKSTTNEKTVPQIYLQPNLMKVFSQFKFSSQISLACVKVTKTNQDSFLVRIVRCQSLSYVSMPLTK